jgi:hypothetical protein
MLLIILKPIKALNSLPSHRTHLPASQYWDFFPGNGPGLTGQVFIGQIS